MKYKVLSSERTRSTASDFETKALLYLMNYRADSNEIHYFVIDFFNDLTGIDNYIGKTWDLQSKAAKNNYQSAIGKELVTLYKNYLSVFQFDHYILFLGGVADSIRIDSSQNTFSVSNIDSVSLTKIKNALIKESLQKTYIDSLKVNDNTASDFLSKVVFVIDDKDKSEYIKSIVKVNSQVIPSNSILEHIFDQIRDAQSSKKNNNNVEGIELNTMNEFFYHNRHITAHDIKMLVLNRVINNNIMQKGVTRSFLSIYNRYPEVQQKGMLEDCQHEIALTLFDKNNSEAFWNLFSEIYTLVTSNKTITIEQLYTQLNKSSLTDLRFLTAFSVQYFMSLIKDGIDED
ncbi:hypothetical protein NST28_15885 [Paenibacillus sp. FSL R10-2791]|uniref:hypothetical protein n=1 Tax=Paenibacillus sp. FSL R10-2791 TaxID=2954695 RepID=UPI0030FC88B5